MTIAPASTAIAQASGCFMRSFRQSREITSACKPCVISDTNIGAG